jgi:hypothetical protein
LWARVVQLLKPPFQGAFIASSGQERGRNAQMAVALKGTQGSF